MRVAERVYMAGTMAGRLIKSVLKERKKANKLLRKHGLIPYDPAAGEEKYWKSSKKIPWAYAKNVMLKFVKNDFALVDACGAVLVLTGDVASDGTWHEMIRAKAKRKIIAIVAPKRASGKKMGFTTVLYPCFSTVEEAVDYIAKEARRVK